MAQLPKDDWGRPKEIFNVCSGSYSTMLGSHLDVDSNSLYVCGAWKPGSHVASESALTTQIFEAKYGKFLCLISARPESGDLSSSSQARRCIYSQPEGRLLYMFSSHIDTSTSALYGEQGGKLGISAQNSS